MAKNVLNDIKNLTSMDIDKLTKDELVDLVASSSKSLSQNIRRLRKSNVANQSALLKTRDLYGKSVVVERKKQSLQKFSKTKLKNELRKIKYTASARTSSIKGTREFAKEFKGRTGVEYSSISSTEWIAIRKKMEEINNIEYTSDDIIIQYEEEKNNTSNRDPNVEDVDEKDNPFLNNVDFL